MDVMREFIGVLKSNPNMAYDFICNNYYRMSKEELKDASKELLYIIHVMMDEKEHDKALGYVAEELENSYYED